MPRNTFLLVILLSAFAVLLAGINIYHRFRPLPSLSSAVTTPQPTLTVTEDRSYYNPTCHFSVRYPADMDVDLVGSASAALSRKDNSDTVLMTCRETIPPPSVTHETVMISSIAATLYHSALKDGSPQDFIIVTHPKYNLQIYIGGFGQALDYVLNHLTFTDP